MLCCAVLAVDVLQHARMFQNVAGRVGSGRVGTGGVRNVTYRVGSYARETGHSRGL